MSKQNSIRPPPKNIGVPTEIVCIRCRVVKNKEAFAVKYHRKLVEHIATQKNTGRFDAKVAHLIPCNACTNQGRHELQCFSCDAWKGVDEFSKTQRKQGDEAVWSADVERGKAYQADTVFQICLKCAEKRDAEDSDSDESNPYYSGDDDDEDAFTTTSTNLGSSKSSAGGIRLPASGATIYAGRSGTTNTTTVSTMSTSSTIDDDW